VLLLARPLRSVLIEVSAQGMFDGPAEAQQVATLSEQRG
jgi:hypothetical protein